MFPGPYPSSAPKAVVPFPPSPQSACTTSHWSSPSNPPQSQSLSQSMAPYPHAPSESLSSSSRSISGSTSMSMASYPQHLSYLNPHHSSRAHHQQNSDPPPPNRSHSPSSSTSSLSSFGSSFSTSSSLYSLASSSTSTGTGSHPHRTTMEQSSHALPTAGSRSESGAGFSSYASGSPSSPSPFAHLRLGGSRPASGSSSSNLSLIGGTGSQTGHSDGDAASLVGDDLDDDSGTRALVRAASLTLAATAANEGCRSGTLSRATSISSREGSVTPGGGRRRRANAISFPGASEIRDPAVMKILEDKKKKESSGLRSLFRFPSSPPGSPTSNSGGLGFGGKFKGKGKWREDDDDGSEEVGRDRNMECDFVAMGDGDDKADVVMNDLGREIESMGFGPSQTSTTRSPVTNNVTGLPLPPLDTSVSQFPHRSLPLLGSTNITLTESPVEQRSNRGFESTSSTAEVTTQSQAPKRSLLPSPTFLDPVPSTSSVTTSIPTPIVESTIPSNTTGTRRKRRPTTTPLDDPSHPVGLNSPTTPTTGFTNAAPITTSSSPPLRKIKRSKLSSSIPSNDEENRGSTMMSRSISTDSTRGGTTLVGYTYRQQMATWNGSYQNPIGNEWSSSSSPGAGTLNSLEAIATVAMQSRGQIGEWECGRRAAVGGRPRNKLSKKGKRNGLRIGGGGGLGVQAGGRTMMVL